MADDDKRSKGRTNETARAKVKTSGERPFDLWLQKQLHAMYDEIASEPLPTDLLGLIETDAEKKDKPPGSSERSKATIKTERKMAAASGKPPFSIRPRAISRRPGTTSQF